MVPRNLLFIALSLNGPDLGISGKAVQVLASQGVVGRAFRDFQLQVIALNEPADSIRPEMIGRPQVNDRLLNLRNYS